jgi:hypothetical protein
MRIIITTFILSFFFFKIFAQAPIVDSSWIPQIGDKFYVDALDAPDFGNKMDSMYADTGMNVTWDLSEFYLRGAPRVNFGYYQLFNLIHGIQIMKMMKMLKIIIQFY